MKANWRFRSPVTHENRSDVEHCSNGRDDREQRGQVAHLILLFADKSTAGRRVPRTNAATPNTS
jgi:hypothetical protein